MKSEYPKCDICGRENRLIKEDGKHFNFCPKVFHWHEGYKEHEKADFPIEKEKEVTKKGREPQCFNSLSEGEKYRRFALGKLQAEQQATGRKAWDCVIEGCEAKTNLLFIHPDRKETWHGAYPEAYCQKCADQLELRKYPEDVVDPEKEEGR